MKTLFLDSTSWKTKDDFYDALFNALGAPSWHGRNFNALRDSIIVGQINKVELPYTIHVSGISKLPVDVRNLVEDFCSLIKEFRNEGHEVGIVCE
jgi:RNAse (barnase) inhibitor barstar